MRPLYLSKEAQDGFGLLQQDLQKLREKNKEYIESKHLKLLDKVSALSKVIITSVISLCVIIGVWYILNIKDTSGFMQFLNYLSDFSKLLHLGW